MSRATAQPTTQRRWVYLFTDWETVRERTGGDPDRVRALLGGKGANLAEMTRLGIPVPPGFTVTTEACIAYLNGGGRFPEGLWEEVLEAVGRLEAATGKRFGDGAAPLLVSCRSGAKFSMPGMMDTILNLGLNDTVVAGLERLTGDARFAFDVYRRLIQMFGSVVMGVPDEVFEAVITAERRGAGVDNDAGLGAGNWRRVTERFKQIYRSYTGQAFPEDPQEQLRLAIEAVFKSWNGKRAVDYRNATGIPHDLGTAVNIQTMVFGNMGEDSATGVAMSRNCATGEKTLEGDFLFNAQGEDVVAGIRQTLPLSALAERMPALYQELEHIARTLERHYRDVQDMEFTIERGKLWLLQTRNAKRTAQAEVRIASDMVEEGLITEAEAVRRVRPDQVEFFLHPQLDEAALRQAAPLARGLPAAPGAAVGVIALDADTAERWGRQDGRPVIMVRPETKPDDVHGMLAAQGVVTARGGRTSHAALVARQFGKPAVVGVAALEVDLENRVVRVGDTVLKEGDWLSVDGTHGVLYAGRLPTRLPDLNNPQLLNILRWADGFRRLAVLANADYPRDAERARSYGAQGIGLCRTEHMFFEPDRLPIVQRMIMAQNAGERQEAIDALEPLQTADFKALFEIMDGLPVTIRLLDPPLHEFLPAYDALLGELADLKIRLQHARELAQIDRLLEETLAKTEQLRRVEALREANPMLGTRGVRLGILWPELSRMQVRAILNAAIQCARDGRTVRPRIMIPLVCHAAELAAQRRLLEEEAERLLAEAGLRIEYQFGTMIEVPRAALTAKEIAEVSEFFSFGTNDLTQTTFGISRDDAEKGFLLRYQQLGLLAENPFQTLDEAGVGRLMRLAVEGGRQRKPELDVGICGEHGGEPKSIALCHRMGLDYVSCSPLRVPVARLAAAHAALAEPRSAG